MTTGGETVGRYRNPILPGCHPDPSVCRVGEWYYLVTSSFEYLPGLPVHRSSNLVDWELIGHVIDRPDQLDLAGLPSSRGLYAPTIRFHDGRFHVVCTVVGPEGGGWHGRAGHFLVSATDPAGPWTDPIWLDSLGGIDPSLTFDGDRVWLCATRRADPGLWPDQTDVWLVELDPQTFAAVGQPTPVWHGALTGAIWAEGPHILARPGGGWMLLAAEGGTARDHAVCVAYADQITGPYRGDPANPRLTHRDLGDRAPIADVGHADLVQAADGRWWATVLAIGTVAGRNGLLGRQTYLVPVEWEDRRPLFAPGSGRVQADVRALGVPDQRAVETAWRDDFTSVVLGAEWAAPGRLPSEFVTLSERRGWARVTASPVEPSEVGQLSFLCRRLPWPGVRVTTIVEHPGGPVRAGLMLRTAEHAYLELTSSPQIGIRAALVVDGIAHEVASVADVPSMVELELEIVGLTVTMWVDGRELAVVDVRGLAPDGSRTFMGPWVGVVAVGQGYVDVDHVALSRLEGSWGIPLDDSRASGYVETN